MEHELPTAFNLDIFTPTADQRYSLGSDIFLRTHYPMTLRRFSDSGGIENVSESQVLNQLLNRTNNYPGNRVWILYGAPGSGKSEFMKWVEVNIKEKLPIQAKVTIRISRTELNLLKIIERFNSILPNTFLSESIYERWEIAHDKPRTLAKILLLFSLEKLLDSDEAINSLFYRLLNDIQIYITKTLSDDESTYPLEKTEFISKEAWKSIINETAINIPINYEQFQYELINAFRNHMLEGFSIINTLRQISEHVKKSYGLRPMLIIDDLVQSLNIFAPDLIDYFITLDEGNWDVVMGMTPGTFEESARGRNLLQRIAYLDTINDRVEKYWLSDENGIDSYVLNEKNCHEFVQKYLLEVHRINQWNGIHELFPFNRECLIRIYRGIPPGKGKARYYLKYIRNILEEFHNGKPLLGAIEKYAHKEFVARISDKEIASICELFGPIIEDQNKKKIKLPKTLLSNFGITDNDLEITVEPLVKQSIRREAIFEILNDEEKIAIRNWLLGEHVNRQLLKGVRQGVARWLRMVYPVNIIYRDSIAKPHGVLRCNKSYLGFQPPIYLEGVDPEEYGICISRQIGNIAFDLYRLVNVRGDEAKLLLKQLASEPSMLELLYFAVDYRKKITGQLEFQLGLPVELFVMSLFTVLLISTGLHQEIPSSFDNIFLNKVNHMHIKYPDFANRLDKDTKESIQFLFEDFFKLRENLFDGDKILQLTRELSPEELLTIITDIDENRIDKDYKLLTINLMSIIFEVKKEVNRCFNIENTQKFLSPPAEHTLKRLQKAGMRGLLMSEAPIEIWSEILSNKPALYERLRVIMDG